MYSKHTRQLFLPDCSLVSEKQFTVSVHVVIVVSAYTTATLTLCLCQQSCDTFPLKTNDLEKRRLSHCGIFNNNSLQFINYTF